MIHGPNSKLIAIAKSYLFVPMVLEMKLQAIWAEIMHARWILGVDHLVIEGDSITTET